MWIESIPILLRRAVGHTDMAVVGICVFSPEEIDLQRDHAIWIRSHVFIEPETKSSLLDAK